MRDRLPIIFSTTAVLVAVFGATPLGEAAYNTVVPKNSVGAQQLRNGAVTNAKLRGDAVTSGKVRNRSLKAIDFAAGQLPAGPKGDTGDKGDRGEPGPTEGVSATNAVISPPVSVTNQILSYTNLNAKFTTTRAGKLALFKDVSAYLTCSGPTVWWWLTLDGSVVPKSFRSTAAGTQEIPLTLFGVTAQSVPAGEHTLGAGGMCTGNKTGAGLTYFSAGSAIVLG